MPASRSEKPPSVAVSPRLEAFLEMLAAERGAARLTLAAYRNDLIDLSGFLTARGLALDAADAGALHAYLGAAETRRLAPRTLARRLSALRQFYRFLLTDGVRADDPTSGLDTPRLGRPLPKLLSEAEVGRLIATAEVWPDEEGARRSCFTPRGCASRNW
jgi:integrase/recombinase XerD